MKKHHVTSICPKKWGTSENNVKKAFKTHHWDYSTFKNKQHWIPTQVKCHCEAQIWNSTACFIAFQCVIKSVHQMYYLSPVWHTWASSRSEAHLFHVNAFPVHTLGHPNSPFYFRHCTGYHLVVLSSSHFIALLQGLYPALWHSFNEERVQLLPAIYFCQKHYTHAEFTCISVSPEKQVTAFHPTWLKITK